MYNMVSGCQLAKARYILGMTRNVNERWVEDASSDAGVRERLIAAAGEHFSKFGYERTTLADVANSIGFSKTYVYRFFKSKQEIGEAICSQCLGKILSAIDDEMAKASSSTEKLRAMLRIIPQMGSQFFFDERKLYDAAAVSSREGWGSFVDYWNKLSEILREILQAGRENGEFERKTPLDEVTRSILLAMRLFIDPNVLQFHLDFVPDGSNEVVSLILRSLAP